MKGNKKYCKILEYNELYTQKEMVHLVGLEPATFWSVGFFNSPFFEVKTSFLLVFYRRLLDASIIFEVF